MRETGLSLSVKYFTDSSKAVLLWIIYVISVPDETLISLSPKLLVGRLTHTKSKNLCYIKKEWI